MNFTASGKTIVVAAAATSPTGVQAASTSGAPAAAIDYLLYNDGTDTVFAHADTTAALAQSGAIIPTSTPQRVYPIAPKMMLVVSELPNAFWSGIVGTTTSNFYVTPGSGS